MVERIPMTYGEYDAFTGWRKVLFWQRGELKKVKRGYNKRFRKAGKREVYLAHILETPAIRSGIREP